MLEDTAGGFVGGRRKHMMTSKRAKAATTMAAAIQIIVGHETGPNMV